MPGFRELTVKALLKKLEDTKIPRYMHHTLAYYIAEGKPTGHFLTAVLTNDLKEACNRADDDNKDRLYDYVFFLYNNAPSACWGSPENVAEWRKETAVKQEIAAAAAAEGS